MKRSIKVVLGPVAALAAGFVLAACGNPTESDPDHAQICVNEENVRVEDEECDSDVGRGFMTPRGHWFYVNRTAGHGVPAVGGFVDRGHGTTVKPSGSISTVSRGGFGGRSSTSGGGS